MLNSVFETNFGVLYEGDCLSVLPEIPSNSVDLVFADPPFNLNKMYGKKSNDNMLEEEYVTWCERWIAECARVLVDGGAFYLYNLPKWNIRLGSFLHSIGLEFRHWIAIEQKSTLPINGRLYPAHYSLLYYTKGKPNKFQKIRTPIEKCRHCGGEVRDYGGHRKAMNEKGVNLKDVWTDIPPVRHKKFKPNRRSENVLSTKILERVIEISSLPGDLVLDPFGGSGTTFAVCEQRHRHWIGIEIEDVSAIVDRLNGEVENHKNDDFVERVEVEAAE